MRSLNATVDDVVSLLDAQPGSGLRQLCMSVHIEIKFQESYVIDGYRKN